MSHIFISHSTKDKSTALRTLGRLRERGYESLFLDSDPEAGIRAGSDWERDLYRNLKLSAAVVVLCSPDSMASRWCFAEITQAKALGKAIFPIVIRPCEVFGSLTDRQVINLDEVGEDEGFQRLFEGLRVAGLDPNDSFAWDRTRPPCPGMLAFEKEDAGLFFGRETETRRVIESLTRLQRQGEPRLLVLVGSSGSGKSSLVRAGVLPRLAKDPARWLVAPPFRPSGAATPLDALRLSLAGAFDAERVDLARRPSWLAPDADMSALPRLEVVADQLRQATGRREASLLIAVDQAEELLQNAGDETSSLLIAALLPKPGKPKPSGRLFVVLTLRSDFLGSFQNHPALRGVNYADIPVGPMATENMPLVIKGPADRAEIVLEPGLVDVMTRDAQTDDALPLLAFTLGAMWERCDKARPTFTLAAYRDDLGGIQGAVKSVVDRVKDEVSWTPEVKTALRRAFLKLARVNDDGQFTRQPARWADLPAEAAPVLARFVAERLLTSNGDVVEVAHESLFRVWPELVAWLDEGRELLLWMKNIQDEMRAWTAHGRSPDWLLGGARAAEARRWLASNADDFHGVEAEFLEASIAADDARAARELAQKERLRKLAQGLAAAAAVAFALALGSLGVGFYAYRQRSDAITQRDTAQDATRKAKASAAEAQAQAAVSMSRQLAAVSAVEVEKDLDLSLILSVEAMRIADTFEARSALLNALGARPGLQTMLHTPHSSAVGAAFSPDGSTIASGWSDGEAGGVLVWETATGLPRGEPIRIAEANTHSFAASPDGQTFGMLAGEEVFVWDDASRRRRGPFLGPSMKPVAGLAFSRDGKTLAVGGSRHVYLIDPADGRIRHTLGFSNILPAGIEGEAEIVAFSADGRTLAVGFNRFMDPQTEGGVVLWHATADGWSPPAGIEVSEGRLGALAVSPDGKTLVTGCAKVGLRRGSLSFWDTVKGGRLGASIEIAEGPVSAVAFHPGGSTVAAAAPPQIGFWGADGEQRRTTFANGSRRETALKATNVNVTSLSYSSDGRTLAVGFPGGVSLYDASGDEPIGPAQLGPARLADHGRASCLVYSPDGKTLLTGTRPYLGERCLALWDAATGRRVAPGVEMPGIISDVASTPDGKVLAVASRDHRKVLLFDGRSLKPLGREGIAQDGSVSRLALSRDGRLLAVGLSLDRDSGVAFWDVLNERRLVASENLKETQIVGFALSPDRETLALSFYRPGAWNQGALKFIDVATGKPRGDDVPIPGGQAGQLAYSPDGNILAVSRDDRVAAFDTTSGHWRGTTFEAAGGHVGPIAYSPDGMDVIAGVSLGRGGRVVRYDPQTGRRRAPDLDVPEGAPSSVGLSPDGETMSVGLKIPDARAPDIAVLATSAVVVFRTADGRRLGAIRPLGRLGHISFTFDDKGKPLVLGVGVNGLRTGSVALRDATGRPRGPDLDAGGGVVGAAFDRDGRTFAVAVDDEAGYCGIRSGETATGRWRGELFEVGEGRVTGVSLRPGGAVAAVSVALGGAKSGGVVFLNPVDGRRLAAMAEVPEGPATDVAYSPDGSVLAVGFSARLDARTGGAFLLDVASGRRRGRLLEAAGAPVSRLVFSPDGSRIAVCRSDSRGGSATFGDVRNGSWLERPFEVGWRTVDDLAFRSQGPPLAAGILSSGDPDHVVIWDTTTSQLWAPPFPIARSRISLATFNQAADTVSVAAHTAGTFDSGGTAALSLDPAVWARRARSMANRNHTRAEWEQYHPGKAYRKTFPDLPFPSDLSRGNEAVPKARPR